MMHVITGGSGSGKSAFAENLVLQSNCDARVYIATMIPYGEEGKQRVERHRKLRSQKNFETIECYTDLSSVILPEHTCVLLECMSNLTANEVFDPAGAGVHAVEAILRGVRHLKKQAKHLYIVTNEVFSDGIQYDSETVRYLSYLGKINQEIAKMADQVTEIVYGIPVKIK